MNWSGIFRKIQPYVVSVETPKGSGTGFLFTYNRDKTVSGIVTAAHVVDYADEWKQPIKLVHCMTKKELFVTDDEIVIFLDHQKDSASIMLFGKSDIGFPEDTLPLIDLKKNLRIGVEVGWMGFPSIARDNLCFFTGRISARLPDYYSYLIDGVAINGVSGGPVAYLPTRSKVPKIIGTVTGYMPNRVYGDTLPGLLRVQDVTAFHDIIKFLKSRDEAKKKRDEQAKREERQPSRTSSND